MKIRFFLLLIVSFLNCSSVLAGTQNKEKRNAILPNQIDLKFQEKIEKYKKQAENIIEMHKIKLDDDKIKSLEALTTISNLNTDKAKIETFYEQWISKFIYSPQQTIHDTYFTLSATKEKIPDDITKGNAKINKSTDNKKTAEVKLSAFKQKAFVYSSLSLSLATIAGAAFFNKLPFINLSPISSIIDSDKVGKFFTSGFFGLASVVTGYFGILNGWQWRKTDQEIKNIDKEIRDSSLHVKQLETSQPFIEKAVEQLPNKIGNSLFPVFLQIVANSIGNSNTQDDSVEINSNIAEEISYISNILTLSTKNKDDKKNNSEELEKLQSFLNNLEELLEKMQEKETEKHDPKNIKNIFVSLSKSLKNLEKNSNIYTPCKNITGFISAAMPPSMLTQWKTDINNKFRILRNQFKTIIAATKNKLFPKKSEEELEDEETKAELRKIINNPALQELINEGFQLFKALIDEE